MKYLDKSFSIESKTFCEMFYHVNQQCCPGGNFPKTPRDPPRGVSGGSLDNLAKSLAKSRQNFQFCFLLFF